MDLCNITDIKTLLGRHGFHFSKRLGQNFLIEPWVPEQIAAASGATSECGVLEIGPGIGPLTVRLAEVAAKVVAVELDRSLLPVLAETLANRNHVEIVPGDILELNIQDLVSDRFLGFTPIVCANLPYNITTPILTALIESNCFSSITVMIQREVALRICAAPGTGDYGSFSVYCQYHTIPELLFDVPPTCFLPAPKVTSTVVRMIPRKTPPVEHVEKQALFQVVKAAFAQRRKTLLNGLSCAYGSRYSKEQLRSILAECQLPPDIRGERLGLCEFAALAQRLHATE